MLTAGSTLQNGKYLIHSVLHQSDFAISYQATHCLLNQPVILQTLNDSLKQHPRFEQIRQLFLQEVRRLAQEQPGASVKVQDYFEESGMPFVVLDDSSRVQAKSADWLNLNRAVLGSPLETAKPVASAVNATTTARAASNGHPPHAIAQSVPLVVSQPAPSVGHKAIVQPVATALSNGRASTARPKRWMPRALLMTAIVGISAGVGVGWSLRFRPLATANAPSIFSSEQSFPDRQDWLGEDPYAGSYARSTREAPSNFLPPVPRRRVSVQPASDYHPRPAPVQEIPPPAPAPKEKAIPLEPIPEASTPTDPVSTPPALVAPPKAAPLPAETPLPVAPATDSGSPAALQ